MDADVEVHSERIGESAARPSRVARSRGVAHEVRTDDEGIVLTDRVLAGMLTSAIEALGPGVRSVRVTVDDETVTALDVDLAGRYGDRLLEVSDEIREVVRAVVLRLLGDGVVPADMSIDVSWVDVTADLPGLR